MLAMREEKIISSSIALEKCRSTIIKEIEKKLALSTNPWQMDLLEKKLETLLIKKNFEQYKTLIKAKMGDHDLKDYKIELFIRLFIVKPILDDNVQRLLESIKEKIKTEFILKFPIETMTLSNFQKESPVLGVDGSPQSFIEKPLESLRNHLSLGSNFDNLVAMIISQVRYLESILSSQADYKVNAEKLAADNSKAMKAIERNCTAILEISVQIFTALCKNYQLAKYMSEENLNGLLVDFEKYVKKLLVRDKRKIGQLSPIIVTEAINLEIKRAWREVKRKFIQDMKFSKKKLEKDDSCKMRVMMQCKQSMEERFKDTFGFIPHSGIFFDECLSKVGENIDNLIKIRNSEHLLMLKPVHESLKLDFNSILSLMLKPETKYRFKYFPVLEDLSPDRILTVNLRKWLVFSFIVFSAQFSDDPHHSQIMSTVQTLATTLDVSNDQDIKEAFEKLTEFETRSQRIEFLQEGQILSQEKLKETMGHLDANQLTYLILGLVTATTDCERDLLELRRAVSQNDIASLRSPNYRKRRLLLQVLGLLNGKDLDWTCQFSLHMIEMLIEKLRLTHNRYVTTKIIKKDLGQIYTTDYNAAFEKFRHKPSEDLISLLNNTMYHENHHPDCKKKEEFEFKKNFVLDMSFRHNKIEGKIVSQNLWQVDEELTLEKITEDLLLKRVFKKLSPKNSGLNCEAESSETIDQKFIAKIQYLRETIKKIKFSSLQSDTSIRSRCSILCISSFEDDESSLWNGWSELSQRFPFTEVTGITCESYTNNHAFGALWNTMKDVSFKSHSNMLVNSASKSLQEQNIDQKQSCSKSDVQLNRKSTKEISTSGFSNPFVEASDEEFQKEFELEDTNERDFVGKNDKINIWKLWKDKKPKEILTRETILKAIQNMSKTQKDAKKPIQAKCLDDDDDIDPEGTMNDQGKELKTNEDTTQDYTYEEISEEAPKYLTVFGLTAGSFDFCSRNPLCEAYHHSSVAGQLLALTQVTMNLFNNNCLCLLGYSFGSLVAFSACLTLFQLGCRDRIGDVCLMASPIDVKVLESSIHKLIGIKGVVQGKLTIVYARCDETLNYFVKSSRLAEEPVGLQRIDHKGLKSSLRENDPVLATYSEDQLDDYLSNKFDNFDASGIVEGHFNYPSKFSRIVQQLDFNNDLSRFINSKHN